MGYREDEKVKTDAKREELRKTVKGMIMTLHSVLLDGVDSCGDNTPTISFEEHLEDACEALTLAYGCVK